MTELLFVAAVGYVLWVFRHTLMANPVPVHPADTADAQSAWSKQHP
jgi:hypothetical protein